MSISLVPPSKRIYQVIQECHYFECQQDTCHSESDTKWKICAYLRGNWSEKQENPIQSESAKKLDRSWSLPQK